MGGEKILGVAIVGVVGVLGLWVLTRPKTAPPTPTPPYPRQPSPIYIAGATIYVTGDDPAGTQIFQVNASDGSGLSGSFSGWNVSADYTGLIAVLTNRIASNPNDKEALAELAVMKHLGLAP